MSIQISKFDDHARSYADSGNIKERKLVSFESPIKGISTLYGWSFLSSDQGGTVANHTHKGFEILCYCISGKLDHQEDEHRPWIPMEPGDLRVIRSGNGVAHTERFAPNTEVFEIWMDPDFRRSLQRPGSFIDYEVDDFEPESGEGFTKIDFTGDESPAYIATALELIRYNYEVGSFNLEVASNHVLTAVVLEGQLSIEDNELAKGDVFQTSAAQSIALTTVQPTSLMVLTHTLQPDYRTYNDQLQVPS